MHKVIIAPFYDEDGGFHGILTGGVSRAKKQYYDDVSDQLIPSFMVFTQQMSALLQNFEVKTLLDMKVQEKTEQVTKQKQEIEWKNAALQQQKEEL